MKLTQNPVKTSILLALLTLGSASAQADLRIEPAYVEVKSAVLKCNKSVDYEDKVTYWIEVEEDSGGALIFDPVNPDRFTLVEDLGEVEVDEVLSNGKTITYTSHDYGGICCFD